MNQREMRREMWGWLQGSLAMSDDLVLYMFQHQTRPPTDADLQRLAKVLDDLHDVFQIKWDGR